MSAITAVSGSAGHIYRLSDVAVDLASADSTRRILSGITLEIRPREIIGIVGRSGTGKTTLLRVLSGLVPVSGGSIELDRQPVTGPPDGVVTVFQDYGNALLPWRTVAKNVALPLEGKVRRTELRQKVADVLELVGLSGREHDYPGSLSGGMQQRVQIARALILQPRVLLMDEPFGALDAMTKASLQDVLLDLHERTDATIIFITHDLEEAIYLSDRAFVIAGSPGHLSLEVECDLPRPRNQITTRELPAYLECRHRLIEALDLAGAT